MTIVTLRNRLPALLLICLAGAAPAGPALKQYDTRFYTIFTDIDPDSEREAAIRMTRMAEEYHERTKDFSGVITQRMPFYLFRTPAEYNAAGGPVGTAGLFVVDDNGGKLMAIAGQKTTLNTWHVVQHEGFHQFAHAVIGGTMPPWMNEGLAEYFGEAIFTGDGFVAGVVPPWRLTRLKASISAGRLMNVADMMQLTHEQWWKQMNIDNYDQAWSMVHFLVHGDDGRYQQAFSACIREISRGRTFERAWADSIGSTDGFQERWKSYWMSQPASPTSHLYAQAIVATFTSFLARATVLNQTFRSFEDFRTTIENGKLKISNEDWLPPSLLAQTIDAVDTYGRPVLLIRPGRQPQLSLTLQDGVKLTGTYTLLGEKVEHVSVESTDPAKARSP